MKRNRNEGGGKGREKRRETGLRRKVDTVTLPEVMFAYICPSIVCLRVSLAQDFLDH